MRNLLSKSIHEHLKRNLSANVRDRITDWLALVLLAEMNVRTENITAADLLVLGPLAAVKLLMPNRRITFPHGVDLSSHMKIFQVDATRASWAFYFYFLTCRNGMASLDPLPFCTMSTLRMER
jgi:hypothetical protein